MDQLNRATNSSNTSNLGEKENSAMIVYDEYAHNNYEDDTDDDDNDEDDNDEDDEKYDIQGETIIISADGEETFYADSEDFLVIVIDSEEVSSEFTS